MSEAYERSVAARIQIVPRKLRFMEMGAMRWVVNDAKRSGAFNPRTRLPYSEEARGKGPQSC
jgi:hypothetical protein